MARDASAHKQDISTSAVGVLADAVAGADDPESCSLMKGVLAGVLGEDPTDGPDPGGP